MSLEFSANRPPLPPLDLIGRVVQPFAPGAAAQEQLSFDWAPQEQLRGLERALGLVGRTFSDFDCLLDFGCGPGRYIRHFGPLSESTEIHGADIDADAIAWLRRNVPYGQFEQIPHEPPTVYDDAFFDLVINHSVFTHLPEGLQDLWMAELQRITKADGIVLLTIHSTPQWNDAVRGIELGGASAESMREQLEGEGILFIADDHFIGSTHPDFYHSTYHAPWYIFERWTSWFELAAYIPLGSHSQDLVVMRRRRAGDDAQRPIGHERRSQDSAPVAAPATAASRPRGGELSEDLEGLLASLPRAENLRQRITRRVLHRELARQAQINQLLAAELRRSVPADPNVREVEMIRVGLYELGRRVSIVADELRQSIEENATSGAHGREPE